MKEEKTLGDTVRKEVVRLALERLQGSIAEKRYNTYKMSSEEDEKEREGIIEQLFVPYVNHDGIALTMDVFEPEGTNGKELPVMILVHGGGLVFGDNIGSRRFARKLARKGYLVFSLQYREAPRANVCQQLDDVCSGMDFLGKKLVEFNVDFSRIYMCAESAGVYLALYVAAMKKSKPLQEAVGYKESNVPIRALGLCSGMFYTNREDPLKYFLREQIYNNIPNDDYFMHFADTEHPYIIKNLPPVFLVTSRGDVLNDYTLSYHKALKKAGVRSHLLYYGEKSLTHAFEFSNPENPKTDEFIEKMSNWFEKVHKEVETKKYLDPNVIHLNSEFVKDIRKKNLTNMPVYRFVKELNKYNGSRTAITTEARKYSYDKMFRQWERYAEVFTGMNITGKNGSRACILYPDSVEAVNTFFGLNMVGTPVSLMTVLEIFDEELWMNTLEKEKITDLFIIDYLATPRLLRLLCTNKERIGLRNIIILKNSLGENAITPVEIAIFEANYWAIKIIPDILFMEDLLVKYEATPIAYADDTGDKEAAIVHTSGTSKGIRKPIPFTNRQLNSAAARSFGNYFENCPEYDAAWVTGLTIDLSGAYGLVGQLLITLISGAEVVINYLGLFDSEYYKVIKKYNITCVEAATNMLETWSSFKEKPDLSNVSYFCVGGTFVSGDAKKRYNELLAECGSKAKISVGYGLSEVGATVTLSNPEEEDDSVGYPVEGIKLKIQDEDTKEFHDITEGPMVGGLYIGCDSISDGTVEGEKYFDTILIDGEKYLCTYDLARVNENGSISICGRMNNYFVNNDGVRFNAGLIENSLEKQKGIVACVIAPSFDKVIHDTVPVLFVKTSEDKPSAITVKEALFNVFVEDGAFKDTNLPVQVLIVNEMPYNQNGKVDRYKLNVNDANLERFDVSSVREGDRLFDVILTPTDKASSLGSEIPDELKKANPIGMDFTKLLSDPENLKFMSPLVISAVLFGRIIPKDKKFGFGGCDGKD